MSKSAYSQSGIMQTSAINEGLAHASSTLSNYGSLFANVAGLAEINSYALSTSYRITPNTPWQRLFSLCGSIPTNIGTFGVGLVHKGDDFYNQKNITVGFANAFGIARIGVKANLIQYSIEGHGTKSIPHFGLGGIVELTEQLFIGAFIENFTQTKIASFENEHYPTTMNAGLSYRPIDKIMINIEVEQDIDYKPSFKTAIGYNPIHNLRLSTGINSAPNRHYFGMSFKPNNLSMNFDYSLSHNRYWGMSHQISLYYFIKKNDEE